MAVFVFCYIDQVQWIVMMIPNESVYPTENMKQVEINNRQQAILRFIDWYCRLNGHSPSLREIGQGVGITSSSHVSYHVHRLLRWGYLGRTQASWRSLFLRKQGYEAIGKESEDDLSSILNELRDENRRLRERCAYLHREQDDLKSRLHGHIA